MSRVHVHPHARVHVRLIDMTSCCSKCAQAAFCCTCFNARIGAWSAVKSDQHPWIQADLLAVYILYNVTTQGRSDYDQWVTSYLVSYIQASDGGGNWVHMSHNYTGNSDRNTKETHELPSGVVTRYIRLWPQTHNEHVSLRFGVTGCPANYYSN